MHSPSPSGAKALALSLSLHVLLGCAQSAKDPDPADACVPEATASLASECEPGAFEAGPYGDRPGDRAADLELPTTSGTFRLSDVWTGCESVVVLALDPAVPAFRTLLGSWRQVLDGPRDVHYVLVSTTSFATQAAQDAAVFEAVLGRELDFAGPEEQAAWKDRFHFVTAPLQEAGWLAAMTSWDPVSDGYPHLGLTIDRFQRIRELGSLSFPAAQNWPLVPDGLADAARHATYEWELAQQARRTAGTVVPLFTGVHVQGSATADVEIPDLAGVGLAELDLRLSCPSGFDRSCGEWDYLVYLRLCRDDEPETCDVELGRWITSYHRGGHWVTDVSPLLALLPPGRHRVRFESSNAYVVDLSLRLVRTCGPVPVKAIPLWKGGAFDETYNPGHPPISVEVPADAERVEVVAVITGHGFGDDVENCAEFCNHEHHFTVGEGTWTKDFPEAGSVSGCRNQVAQGVTPNQFGTWIFGRGGWCPGFDVPPFVADVTGQVRPGRNTIGYRATLRGEDHVPQRVANPSNFAGRIDLESWLVIWK